MPVFVGHKSFLALPLAGHPSAPLGTVKRTTAHLTTGRAGLRVRRSGRPSSGELQHFSRDCVPPLRASQDHGKLACLASSLCCYHTAVSVSRRPPKPSSSLLLGSHGTSTAVAHENIFFVTAAKSAYYISLGVRLDVTFPVVL